MAIKTVQVCDKCGKECPYDSIYAVIAEGSENVTEAVDLCPLCCRKVLADLVAAMTPELAALWVRTAREPLPVVRC